MRAALSAFSVQVRDINRTVGLGERLVALGQAPPNHLNPTATALRRSVRSAGMSGMQPILDGSVLLLAAAFEQFISDAMVEFTSNLPQIVPDYSDLPNAVRSANERLTGEALTRRTSRFERHQLRRFIANLRDCHSGVRPYALNGEAIAFNRRNLNANTLQELISRLGIQDIWEVAASTRSLRNWSGVGGARTAQTRAKDKQSELIRVRNDISHGAGRTAVGTDIVRSYIRFEGALARSLTKCLEDYSTSL